MCSFMMTLLLRFSHLMLTAGPTPTGIPVCTTVTLSEDRRWSETGSASPEAPSTTTSYDARGLWASR
jgi:hypothetical protein